MDQGSIEAEDACEVCDRREIANFDGTLLQPLQPRPTFLIDSSAAYVFDTSCDVALYGKNAERQFPPASLTKMMTALVAIEHGVNLDQLVTVDVSARDLKVRTRSSVMGLEPAMQVTMRDLLYGLMLPSGNDASLEIARAVAGDVDSFVAMMNEKAAELGLTGTRFANPHGLDAPELHSTARDLVVLGEAMMAHPVLAEIARAAEYRLSGGLSFKNGNRMLGAYPGAYGVKIGYTGKAAHTVVVAAERDGRHIYASVLGSHVPYVDATALLDWAFSTPRRC